MGKASFAMSAVTLLGVAALLIFAFGVNVVPMVSERLVAAEGLAIGTNAHIVVTREMCFSRENEATATRIFLRVDDGDAPGEGEEGYEAPLLTLHFDGGCQTLSRRLDVPSDLRAGRYRYKAALRYCNLLNRCQTAWLTPLEIIITGEGPRRLLRARAS